MNKLLGVLTILLLTREVSSDFDCDVTSESRPTLDTDEEIIEYLGLNITCNDNDVEVRMNACALEKLGYDPLSDIAAGNATSDILYSSEVDDDSCMGIDEGDNVVLLQFNMSLCSPDVSLDDSNIVYTQTIRHIGPESSDTITRVPPFGISFTCSFISTMDKSLAFSIYPVYYASAISISTQEDEYTVMIAMFQNNTFLHPVSAYPGTFPEVEVGENIHVGVTTESGEKYLALEASYCWATSTPDVNDTERFDILIDGCTNRKQVTQVYKNFKYPTVEFQFRSISWFGSGKQSRALYVHCDVSLCDWVLDEACLKKSCSNQDVTDDAKDNRKIKKTFTLGPIKVHSKNTECAINNGGCSHFCTLDGKGGSTCLCPNNENWYLGKGGLACKNIRMPKADALSWNQQNSKNNIPLRESTDQNSTVHFVISSVVIVFVMGGVSIITTCIRRIRRRNNKGRFDL